MSEKSEAKRDGAKLQKNSGRGKHEKGDATLDGWLIDYKEYPKGISVNTKVWGKVCSDALKVDAEPALKLVLGEGQNKVRLFVISETMFHEMNEAYNRNLGPYIIAGSLDEGIATTKYGLMPASTWRNLKEELEG